MSAAASLLGSAPRRRVVLMAVFLAVTMLLALAYYAFLRVDYVPVWSNLKPADAAAIVAELESKGVAHRLSDGGTTILVPVPQADSVRLSVAGSDVPMKGAVGFELFNKSDMGLTDFAQKINYQRALQGELARSIMMMDGIETARVHLAMPERALFRGNQSPPKAAVEVIARPGQIISPDRVAGIQRLVAAAVPELPLAEVVVLDGAGRVIGDAAANVPTGEVDEQTAVQAYFSARARTALENQLPGVRFTVRTTALRMPAPADGDGAAARRDFVLHLLIASPARLAGEDEEVARRAVAAAIDLDAGRGDTIAFDVAAPAASALPRASAPYRAALPDNAAPDAAAPLWPSWLPALLVGLLIAGGYAVLRRRRARPDPQFDALIARIEQHMRNNGDDDAGR